MGIITDLLDCFTGRRRHMSDADRRRWQSARTLPDLCDLTAGWLTGEIASQPGYYGPVDVDEDDAPGMTDVLVALNRSGYVTNQSQAGFDGVGYDRARWTQRAAVFGFADTPTVDRLAAALAGTRFVVFAYHGFQRGRGVVVTAREGAAFTSFGRPLSRRTVVEIYGDACSDEMIDVLCGVWQVTVYDPQAGSNDMWRVLGEAVNAKR